MAEIKPANAGESGDEKKEIWWLPAMYIFFRAAAWIAGPVIIALYIGRSLEDKYGSGSHLILISVALAFIVTMIGLVKITLAEFRKMDNKK